MRRVLGLVVAALLGCNGAAVSNTDGPPQRDRVISGDVSAQSDAVQHDAGVDLGADATLDAPAQHDALTDLAQVDVLQQDAQHDAQIDTAPTCGLEGQTCCADTGTCWYTDGGIRICDTCPYEVDGGLLGRGVLGCSPYSHTCMDCGLVGKPCCWNPYGGGSWWCDGSPLHCATDNVCRY